MADDSAHHISAGGWTGLSLVPQQEAAQEVGRAGPMALILIGRWAS